MFLILVSAGKNKYLCLQVIQNKFKIFFIYFQIEHVIWHLWDEMGEKLQIKERESKSRNPLRQPHDIQ